MNNRNSKKQKLKYISNFNKSVGRTIYSHQLIEDGDKILVGISGGKDSLVLLETIANRRKYLPFKFEIIAAHISVKNISFEIDRIYLENLCKDLNISLVIQEISIDLEKDIKKDVCFVCSWHRRKALFNLSKELHCNKLALGHHMDDANETFLMNLIYHGSICSMPYKLKMFNGRMFLIRPLLDQKEDKIKLYAKYRKFPKEVTLCYYGDKTRRNEIKKLLKKIERIHPTSLVNIFRSPKKIIDGYLPK